MFENEFFDFYFEKSTGDERFEQLKQICFNEGTELIVPNRFQQLKIFNLALYLDKLAEEWGGEIVVSISHVSYHGTVTMLVNELRFKSNEEIVSFTKYISCCSEFKFKISTNNKIILTFEVPYVFNRRRDL